MAEKMSNSSNKILIKTKDNEIFEMEETAAMQSQMLKYMILDGCVDDVIPLQNVSGKIMAKIVEYCNTHITTVDSKEKFSDGDMKKFDDGFIDVDEDTLFDLMLAANYLEIKTLFDLTCQTVADLIKGKTPEEVRKLFKIENDFTKEEEEEIRRENAWAFEDY